jgi:carboxyl-terminal processing protease
MVDVVGWRLDDVVQLIRGPAGSSVRLSVLPAGATPGAKENVLEFQRNKVTLEAQAAQKKVQSIKRDDRDIKVGVIEVPSFYQDYDARVNGEKDYRSTTRDVSRLIGELKKENVDGIVLDLRGNGGGHLSEATGLSACSSAVGRSCSCARPAADRGPRRPRSLGEVWDGSGGGARGSLQRVGLGDLRGRDPGLRRGLVVGQQTYGKGTVQNLYPLDRWALGPNANFGQLTVTIGKYYRVTGDSVQNRGVVPEITLPSLISATEVGESTRDSALPWDRIAGVPFRADDSSAPRSIAQLALEESSRAKKDPDYRWLVSDIAALETVRQQKSVSLNLKARREERTRIEAERLARENARRASQQKAPLKSVEEIDADEAPDVVLDQAAEVMADMVRGLSPSPAATAPPSIRAGAPKGD